MDPTDDEKPDDFENKEEEFHVISKRLPEADGVYIEGSVNGLDVHVTMDTGASSTILSYKVYEQLGEENRPQLQGKSRLQGADGSTIQVYGNGVFDLQLGSLTFQRSLLVADIQDEVLLGIDILQNSGDGQADILLSQGLIRFNGHEVPCIQRGMQKGITLRCVERCDIPGNSEVIIPVFVQRECEADVEDDLIFEPSRDLMEKTSLLLAPAVINIRGRKSVPLRVMNPYDEVRTLHTDTVVGTVEGYEGEVSALVPVENDLENLRRSAEFGTDEGSSGPHEVPAHLLGLFDDSSRSLTDSEREDFRKFLIDHQSAFSKDEWDLGQTSLLEHEIPTGDSKPVKQPPRRVPIALAKEERDAIMNLKERGIIRPSTSPWSSLLVLAGKVRRMVELCSGRTIQDPKEKSPNGSSR